MKFERKGGVASRGSVGMVCSKAREARDLCQAVCGRLAGEAAEVDVSALLTGRWEAREKKFGGSWGRWF